jgi:hypothetical protein
MLGLETWSSLTDDELNELALEIPTQTILFRALTGVLHMRAHFYSQHWLYVALLC